MGTELTGINKNFISSMDYNTTYAHVNWIIESLKSNRTPFEAVHRDDHCIEISSKKLRSFEQYENFSKKIRALLKNENYFPKCEETVCGGAHIHVNMRGNKEFAYFLCRDLVMRPYLPWIFGEPDENEAMDVLINSKVEVEKIKKDYDGNPYKYNGRDSYLNGRYIYKERFLFQLMKPYNRLIPYFIYSDDFGKGYMFRLSHYYKTLEFRFFEMTETWEEQKLQMEFLCAYLKWMQKRFKKGITTRIKLMTDPEMQKIRPIQCVRKFHRLCTDIGVNFNDYKPFITRNLYPRWRNGRVRR